LPSAENFQTRTPFSHRAVLQEGTASTSSLALSRFDFPKPPDAFASTESIGQQKSLLHCREQESSKIDTPTTFHYGGVSFDLINPHDSLRLSAIMPSVDADGTMLELSSTPTLQQLVDAEVAAPDVALPLPPTRPMKKKVFGDLASAHASIGKKSLGLCPADVQ